MIKLVILDWAGTTVDFGCFAPVNAFLSAFKKNDVEITVDEAREPMGMLKVDHIRAILKMKRVNDKWIKVYKRDYNEEDVVNIYATFEKELFKSLEYFTSPIEGVKKVVECLKENNIRIGSTTGYTNEMMNIVKKGAYLKGYSPEYLVTAENVYGKGRPYPYMIFKNMEHFQIQSTKEVIKVGDTVTDIREGKNAGCYSVGVIIGSSELGLSIDEYENLSIEKREEKILETKEKFLKAGADYIIDSLKELPNLIEKLN